MHRQRQGRKPYEFGVKVSVAVTHKQGLLVGARSFTGNPYDGHILSAQMEQSTILLQDLDVNPRQVVVDLGFRGKDVDLANPDLEIIHRGRIKTMTEGAATLAQTKAGRGARHRAPEVGQAHAALLAARCNGGRVIPFPDQSESRREAADSAVARQGEATTYRIDLELESQGWHPNISYAEDGSIVEIVLLDAKKEGLLPLEYRKAA